MATDWSNFAPVDTAPADSSVKWDNFEPAHAEEKARLGEEMKNLRRDRKFGNAEEAAIKGAEFFTQGVSKMFPTSAIGGVMDALGVQPPIPAEHVRQAREFLSGLPARAEIPADVPTVGPTFDPGVEQGVNQFVDELISGLTRPDQAMAIAASGKFPTEVARTFQLAPVVEAPQQVQQIQQASEAGDVPGTVKGIAGLTAGALLPSVIEAGINKTTAITKGKPNARPISEPATLYGDVRPLEKPAEILPTEENLGRIQSEAPGGIPATPESAQPARPREENQVPLNRDPNDPAWRAKVDAERYKIVSRAKELSNRSGNEFDANDPVYDELAQAIAAGHADEFIEQQAFGHLDLSGNIGDEQSVAGPAGPGHEALAAARETANDLRKLAGLKPIPPLTSETFGPKSGEAKAPVTAQDIAAMTPEEFKAFHDAIPKTFDEKGIGADRAAVNDLSKSLVSVKQIADAEKLVVDARKRLSEIGGELEKQKDAGSTYEQLQPQFAKSMMENQRVQFLDEAVRTAKARQAVEGGMSVQDAVDNFGVHKASLESTLKAVAPEALPSVESAKSPEPVKPVEVAKNPTSLSQSLVIKTPKGNRRVTVRVGMEDGEPRLKGIEFHNDATGAYDIFNSPNVSNKKFLSLEEAQQAGFDIVRSKFKEVKEIPKPSKQAELTFEEQKAEQAASRGAEVSSTPQEVTPSAQALGFAAPATKFGNGTLNVGNAFKHAAGKVGDFWRSFSMQELPKITKSDRPTGEAGVRYAAAPYVARAKGAEMAGKVLDGFKPDMDLKMGTAVSEDNLRSIQKGFQDEAQALAKKGDLEGAEKAQKAASNVATLIGQKNSPFKTEADYQAFLKSPEFQDASARYDALWQSEKDPLFRQANDLDPDLPLESRGLQTGLRVNLKAVPKEEGTATTIGNAGKRTLIKQTATLLKRDPFAQRAKGSGTSYEGSLTELLSHGFEREYPVATQHEFIKSLIDSGDAVLTQKEYMPDLQIKGEATKGYLQKLRPFAGRFLHIRKSLAPEYQAVSGLDPAVRLPIYSGVADFLTRQSVAGLAEGSTHVANIATEMFTGLGPTANPLINAVLKSAGRADVLWSLPKIIMKGFSDNASEMLKLKTIGAGKQEFKSGGIFKPMSAIINGMDKGSRLVAADVYKGMAKEGWVEDTETGLRQYVNKVGQYEKRLQPLIIRVLRDTGVQPFATAAHTFNVQALRNIVLAPGAKSPTNLGALSLRIEKAAGILGAAALIAGLNQLLSGKPEGPKGTKLGEVGWIGDDHKVHKFDVLGLMGYRRSLSRTGIGPVIEAKRAGLTGNQQLKQGVEAVANTGVSYVSGPLNRTLTVAATGYRPSVPPVRESKAVPPVDKFAPLKSQTAENIKTALQQANPLVDAVASQVQGKTGTEIAQRQLSRFTPRTGTTETKAAALPKIVKASEMNDYSDNLAKALRKLDRIERYKKAKAEMADMQPKDRNKILDKLRRQGVFTYQ